MPNDPRAERAVGMLTAFMHSDREGFDAVLGDFDGGCAEALAALARVAHAIVGMFADAVETTPDEIMRHNAGAAPRLPELEAAQHRQRRMRGGK